MTRNTILVALLIGACGQPREITQAPKASEAATAAEAPAAPAAESKPDPLVEELNLDFERGESGAPAGWYAAGNGYEIGLDQSVHESGERSLRLRSTGHGQFGVANSVFPVERARGKRLKLTGYLKSDGVTDGYAGLWLRIDGPGRSLLGFDNMNDRGVTGSTPWRQYEIELDVPEKAVDINFGALLTGKGTAWVDDLRFEVLDEVAKVPIEISGVVADPEGKPIVGALVALVAPQTLQPVSVVASGPEGRFRISASAGIYGLTATAPGQRAAYVPARSFPVDGELKLETGSGGFTVSGTLTDENGAPIANELVGAMRISDDVADLWYSRTDVRGAYSMTLLEADKYRVYLPNTDLFGEKRPISGRADIEVDLRATRRAPAADEVIDWIAKHAIRLKTVEAGNGFDDMKRLAKLVGKARVIALGEATHGTREFFQMKHRMLEFLVEKMGFTVFAIEANFTESLAINDYVLHGKGDAKKALAGIYFWTWNTEEVLALIEWMREYNANARHRRKIKFYGFDMQEGAVAAASLLAYLKRVDPGYASQVADTLGPMSETQDQKQHAADLGKPIAAVIARLDTRRGAYMKKSSRREWQIMRQNAVVLSQLQRMNDGSEVGFNVRDESMAANLQWILDFEGKGTKAVVWAHNGHIAEHSRGNSIVPMGSYLAKALGKRYVAMGFAFNRGGFQARDWTKAQHAGLNAFEVGPAPPDAVGATFARAGCSICVLDLRPLVGKKSVPATWFSSPIRMREIGAVYAGEEMMLSRQKLLGQYDAIVFVDQTTRARPLESVEVEEPGPKPPL